MPKPIAIKVLPNGPLRVSGPTIDVDYCGERVEVDAGADVYLCRCGESSKPPFCDGSHAKTGFVGESETKPDKEIKVWQGKTIKTYFNPNACMHVFYCKPLKELRARELAGDSEAAAEIAAVVRSCPSGALSFESAEVEAPSSPAQAHIDIVEGGEVRVQCEFDIDTQLQERQVADRATLCRCGLSDNKPWCDGRHRRRQGFK